MKNPFEYGGIVGQDSFCNRHNELKDLARIFENGEKVFLYAERRLGKTSLLKLALSRLSIDEYIPVYVDLWPTGNETELAAALVRAVAQAAESAQDKAFKLTKEFFSHFRPSMTLDHEGKATFKLGVSQSGDPDVALSDTLAALPRIATRKKKQLVVVLDEFQQVSDYQEDTVERRIRSAIQDQKIVSYVFSGSKKHVIQDMFLNKQRPLYRSAGHYPLGPIKEIDWLPFISKKFSRTGKQTSGDLVMRITSFTAGHPFYTQHLCHAIWELTEDGAEADNSTFDSAVSLLLDRENYAFSTLWESLSLNQRTLLTAIAQAETPFKPFASDFVRTSGMRTASNVQRATDSLLNKDIIERDDRGSFFISDRFLRLWVERKSDESALLPTD